MPRISEEKQHEITAQHLRGTMAVEVWLIPFCITLSIVAVVIVAMIVHHVLKQRRRNIDQPRDYRAANTGESDEMLTFACVVDENRPNGTSLTADEDVEDEQEKKREWPPRMGCNEAAWGGLPSSNL